jgi:hypothetical protein
MPGNAVAMQIFLEEICDKSHFKYQNLSQVMVFLKERIRS